MMKPHKRRYRLTAMALLGGVIHLSAMASVQALDIPATLYWSKRVDLGTPVSGVIKTIAADTGDKVEKDAVLIKLDDRNFVAALSMARARVKDLNERRLEAKRELDRAEELYNRTVLSDQDLQTAKNAKVAADSDYESAKAALVKAELDLEYTSIRAPFTAYVLHRNAEVGQTVVSQLKPETLITVAAAGEMLARAYIAQADLDGIQRGQPAKVVVAGNTFDGQIKHVGLEPVKTDKQGIYYEIVIVFNTGVRILRAGQQVTIKLP